MTYLLEVDRLQTVFWTGQEEVTSVDEISFKLRPGETIGIVGESGCGKSVTSLSIMRLLGQNGRIKQGEIRFNGSDLVTWSESELRRLRGKDISMIFQEPMSSLNPVFTIGNQLLETIRQHTSLSRKEAKAYAIDMLRKVGLPQAEAIMNVYPHTLSGGMRQRIMIAMALSCKPKLLIADEPTTALDVTIQAQILELMKDLREESGAAIMLITHDLGVVAEMADKVVVMYAGQIVEEGRCVHVISRTAASVHARTAELHTASRGRQQSSHSDSRSRPVHSAYAERLSFSHPLRLGDGALPARTAYAQSRRT